MINDLKVEDYNILKLPNYKEITTVINKAHQKSILENQYTVHYLQQVASEKNKEFFYKTYNDEITAVYYAQAIYSDFKKFTNIIDLTKVAGTFKENKIQLLKQEINSNSDKHLVILNKLGIYSNYDMFADYIKANCEVTTS